MHINQFQVTLRVRSHGLSSRTGITQSLGSCVSSYYFQNPAKNTEYVARSYILAGVDGKYVIMFLMFIKENTCACIGSMFSVKVYQMLMIVCFLALSPSILCAAFQWGQGTSFIVGEGVIVSHHDTM